MPVLGTALLLTVLLLTAPAAGSSFVEDVRRDTAWLAGVESRAVGMPGHDAALARLIAEASGLPNVIAWTHPFRTVAPIVDSASLTLDDGPFAGAHRVYPLGNSGARLVTTPAEGIAGRLIYAGRCEPERIPARSLLGQIAVIEADSGGKWSNAWNAGANAVLLLGNPRMTFQRLTTHLSPAPVNFPRFFIPDGPLADALREGRMVAGRIGARSHWQEVQAANFYALVRPEGFPETGAPERVLTVAVPFDTASIVPELAPGADGAVDVAFALNLLRAYAAHPPHRPVLFAFIDAFSVNQLGMREFLAVYALSDEDWRRHLRRDERLVAEYQQHEALAREVEESGAPLDVFSRAAYRPLHRYLKDEVSREVVAIETELFPLRVEAARADPADRPALERQVRELSDRRGGFFGAQRTLLSGAVMSEAQRQTADVLWGRARERIARQLDEARAVVHQHVERQRLRARLLADLGLAQDGKTRALGFVMGLDLSDAGISAGPHLSDPYWIVPQDAVARDFTRWLVDQERQDDGFWPESLRRGVDTSTLGGMVSSDSYRADFHAAVTGLADSFGVAAVTWATLNGVRQRVDTPMDQADRLDWERLGPQIDAARFLLDRFLGDPAFRVESKGNPQWSRLYGTIVDQSPGEPAPRLPMPGYLTTTVSGWATSGQAYYHVLPECPGLRRQEFRFSGTDGRVLFDAMPGRVALPITGQLIQSYQVADDGRFLRAVDLARGGKGVSLGAAINSANPTPFRAVVFDCVENSAVGFFDPRFLVFLPQGTLYDTRRGGAPQRANYSIHMGRLSALLEPATRWHLVLRAGTTRNRLVLLDVADPDRRGLSDREAIQGFGAEERIAEPPVHVSARDFHRLDERRVRDYRRAGIRSDTVEALRERTAGHLDDADLAVRADDGAGLHRAAGQALASEVRAYHVVRATANDVIRAAIFLLLVLVPFSYVIERLFVGTPHVYRQILGFVLVFAVMTAILWSFHPAFRISNQPLMIVMAFGILFMSLLVISVVYSKFDSGLEELRSGRTETSGAETARGSVIPSAFQLGIANMRRRKVRTVLTAVTVSVITYTLLCFTSTTRYTDQREVDLNLAPPFEGVLVRQPSYRHLPLPAVDHLQLLAGPAHPVVARYWWVNMNNPQWRVLAVDPATGRTKAFRALLGLSRGEEALTGVDARLPQWARFVRGEGGYLDASAARDLGVAPGGSFLVAGRPLELLGVYESADLDGLIDLDGQSLFPPDYSSIDQDERNLYNSQDVQILAGEMERGSGLSADLDLPRLSSADCIIAPATLLLGVDQYSLRTLAIPSASAGEAREMAVELGRNLAFPIYYSGERNVRAIAATVPIPEGPAALLIPLLIGGLIIFNTMLGSIAERQREIYIFTSMGLAPLHIGALFLAEGIAYGLMGSIFGYIAGQGLASVFSHLGWLGGITLNYSGTHAIQTMLMVLAVVTLASLFPAYLAGKLAMPSAKMTWQVPAPVDDVIRYTLPFTVSSRTANGVMVFLYEYLDIHREGGVGNFSTDDLEPFRIPEFAEADLYGVAGTVWLAPYDLGIRQTFRLSLCATDLEDVYEIAIELERMAGPVSTWHKLNKVFLGDLRRQLLGWRKLKLQRMIRYIGQAGMLKAAAQAAGEAGAG